MCTIGPATCGSEQLEALAVGGMNVARINMCHGTREWHKRVIERVRKLNEEKGYAVAIMMDTEGSEIHMGDLGGASSAKAEVKLSDFSRNLRTFCFRYALDFTFLAGFSLKCVKCTFLGILSLLVAFGAEGEAHGIVRGAVKPLRFSKNERKSE